MTSSHVDDVFCELTILVSLSKDESVALGESLKVHFFRLMLDNSLVFVFWPKNICIV